MEDQFVPFELAVKLKELGFNEKCFSVYDTMGFHQDEREMNLLLLDYIKAPLWQQAFDWLFNNFSYICIIKNNMSYEQKQEKLKEAIRYIQDNKPK